MAWDGRFHMPKQTYYNYASHVKANTIQGILESLAEADRLTVCWLILVVRMEAGAT